MPSNCNVFYDFTLCTKNSRKLQFFPSNCNICCFCILTTFFLFQVNSRGKTKHWTTSWRARISRRQRWTHESIATTIGGKFRKFRKLLRKSADHAFASNLSASTFASITSRGTLECASAASTEVGKKSVKIFRQIAIYIANK